VRWDAAATRKTLVGSIFADFGVRYRDLKFTYIQTYRRRGFKEQNSGHEFGPIAVS
jgi:hypothetical protein